MKKRIEKKEIDDYAERVTSKFNEIKNVVGDDTSDEEMEEQFEEEELDNNSSINEVIIAEQEENAYNYELSERERYNHIVNQQLENSLNEIVAYDIREGAYEKSLDVIRKFLLILGLNETPMENAELIYDKWIFDDDEFAVRSFRGKITELEMWKNGYKYLQTRRISEVGMRLVSIGTSESDVERLISIHRFIVRGRMTNISDDLLLARLRLRTIS